MSAVAASAVADQLAAVEAVSVYSIGMRTRFRGITVREGMVLRGPSGWGEFCPFDDYGDAAAVPWLAAALEQATSAPPAPVRDRVPVNCTVPAVGPDAAYELVARSGCRTAKVKVADHRASLAEDQARVEAVRAALGADGAVRVDANAAWDVDTAVRHIRVLDRAAGGLEYVEQPCPTLPELARVRRAVDVRIAADESIRRAEDPLRVAVAGAADVAVLKCAPLGGPRRALSVAEACGLPCVVSSALETSVGLAAEVALAAALPELPFACGLGTLSLLEGDVVGPEQALVAAEGVVRVPTATPRPDPAMLAAYAPADPVAVARWLARYRRVSVLLTRRERR
nr:o-succinylbenzoate synthase [Saccharomonospora piscinae]